MRVIFCDSGFSPKEVDYMYSEEYAVAKQLNIPVSLINFEALKRGDATQATKRVLASEDKTLGIYRGWMLKPNQYETLYEVLLTKNIQLINSPSEYKYCHYLPESYDLIRNYTPKSTFKKLEGEFKIADFERELAPFGNYPIVIKDYVKSQKHYWKEACFIPDASNKEQARSVIERFIELQDIDLNEGLVFREFVALEKLTNHSESGMPLTKEFRIFIKDKKVIGTYKYWDEGDYQSVEPAIEDFKEVITQISSNFFTMDIAKRKNGDWIIVELGDGQVAGLPDNADKLEFYQALNS